MIDLEKEQKASLERPRYKYSLAARFFFSTMDIVTGKKTTFAKAKLIETLASIPYRAWEIRQYGRLTRLYRQTETLENQRNSGNGEEKRKIMNTGISSSSMKR